MPTAVKRKKTPDMPDSPPKRVTRARAKIQDNMEEKITRSKKPAVPKAGVRIKTPAVGSAKPIPRKTRSDDASRQLEPEIRSTEVGLVEASKTRAHSQISNQEASHTELVPEDAKRKPRTRKASGVKTAENAEEAPKIRRGRPKKSQEVEALDQSKEENASEESNINQHVTRSEAAARSSRTMTSKPAATARTTKKRVKFEDDLQPDKENIPLPSNPKGNLKTTAAGLRARPVRKNAPTRPAGARSSATTRKKSQMKDGGEQDDGQSKSMPLSPKKITQVTGSAAKSGSIGSEDELSGDKTPVRALSRSAVKGPQSILRSIDDSPLKVDLGIPGLRSPTKRLPANVLTSPARRPPASPFKDSMKESPRRAKITSQQCSMSDLINKSPSKSTLQMSPKRGLLLSANRPTFAQQPTTQSSLLQSPARRPLGSPSKSIFAHSPIKSVKKQVVSSEDSGPQRLAQTVLTDGASSSPFKADRSRSTVVKPCSRTPETQFTKNTLDYEQNSSESVGNQLLGLSAKSTTVTGSTSLPGVLSDGDIFNDDFENLAKSSPISVNAAADTFDTNSREARAVNTEARSTTPPDHPRHFTAPSDIKFSSSFRDIGVDVDSEDELSSPTKVGFGSGLSNFGISSKDFADPFIKRVSISPMKAQPGTMTPLATKMSSWAASSPRKAVPGEPQAQVNNDLGMAPTEEPLQDVMETQIIEPSPAKPSQFEEQMDIHEVEEDISVSLTMNVEEGMDVLKSSMESSSSTEYGDENEIPLDPKLLIIEGSPTAQALTCTPAKVFQTREFHTVSKVPLRPADDEVSPIRLKKKRSKSISGHASGSKIPQYISQKRNSVAALPHQPISLPKLTTSTFGGEENSSIQTEQHTEAEGYDLLAHVTSPIGSTRKPVSSVLQGVTAFVNVHTSEGADASGIFHDLLGQMGAKCVKQWNWNPHASIANNTDGTDENAHLPRPGITHVIYKDGGKRTLEKVRAAKGAVDCVGVGWVLDCERQMTHLSECDYAIDTSLMPRGGSRRRKSMEPKALANLEGTLVPAFSAVPASSGHSPSRSLAPAPVEAPQMSPCKEFLTFDTPQSRRETFILPKPSPVHTQQPAGVDSQPSTPTTGSAYAATTTDAGGFDSPLSPTTPYYLSKGAALVQQTCPPINASAASQDREGLGLSNTNGGGNLFAGFPGFPVSGDLREVGDTRLRERLERARRLSLAWVPKVGSPLRGVSYGL